MKDKGDGLLLFDLPKTLVKDSAMPTRKQGHNIIVRFRIAYEIAVHYNNTYVREHEKLVGTRIVTIHEILQLCKQFGLRARKSAIYNIISERRYKLPVTIAPVEIQEALELHVKEHTTSEHEAKPLPVKFIVSRKLKSDAEDNN